MVIPFTLVFIVIGYLFYQTKDDANLIEKESPEDKDDIYIGLDDLFI